MRISSIFSVEQNHNGRCPTIRRIGRRLTSRSRNVRQWVREISEDPTEGSPQREELLARLKWQGLILLYMDECVDGPDHPWAATTRVWRIVTVHDCRSHGRMRDQVTVPLLLYEGQQRSAPSSA